MLTDIEQQRYNRHLILSEIGVDGQEKLKNARVLVIGAGGLGCPVLQYLAAAGVGNIGVVDFDVVDISNLQRQILFNDSQIGKSKAFCAAEAIHRINPCINIHPYNVQLTSDNALPLIADYDIVVDGTDNFATRYMINDACYILRKPLVFGAIYKFDGQLTVFHLQPDSPTYRSIFPEPPLQGTVPNCSEIGVIGVLPGIIGSLQALEVIKIITGIGEPLDGRFLCYDSLSQTFTTVNIDTNRFETFQIQPIVEEFRMKSYAFACSNHLDEVPFSITVAEFYDKIEQFRIIDIREMYELPNLQLPNLERIPFSEIPNHPIILDHKPTVLICQKGFRSLELAIALAEKYPSAVLYSLFGGVEELR